MASWDNRFSLEFFRLTHALRNPWSLLIDPLLTLVNLHNYSFDKTKVLCLLLHSCDVSHPAKRWDVHWQWTARCIEEFFDQGDREAELGLEYSPLCDRHNTMVPQSQIGNFKGCRCILKIIRSVLITVCFRFHRFHCQSYFERPRGRIGNHFARDGAIK